MWNVCHISLFRVDEMSDDFASAVRGSTYFANDLPFFVLHHQTVRQRWAIYMLANHMWKGGFLCRLVREVSCSTHICPLWCALPKRKTQLCRNNICDEVRFTEHNNDDVDELWHWDSGGVRRLCGYCSEGRKRQGSDCWWWKRLAGAANRTICQQPPMKNRCRSDVVRLVVLPFKCRFIVCVLVDVV